MELIQQIVAKWALLMAAWDLVWLADLPPEVLDLIQASQAVSLPKSVRYSLLTIFLEDMMGVAAGPAMQMMMG